MNIGTAYLAAEGFEKQLAAELSGVTDRYDRLFVTDQPPQDAFWAQNIWHNPIIAKFEAISEAATLLKNIQRNWAHYPFSQHRRASLIEEKLPHISFKPLKFPARVPESALGSWTLLDKNTLLAAATCSSPFKNGQVVFDECREGPPSRAYLKLWEALTLIGKVPQAGDKCLEIGSSPGGWTWVLAQLGAEVLSVDRSPLEPSVAAMPGVHFKAGNAFAMTPETVGAVEWIFSDVACYPEKLLEWVRLWLDSGLCQNYVCTLKFQGDGSYDAAKEFAKIPGSKVMHLGYNKHELTWMLVRS